MSTPTCFFLCLKVYRQKKQTQNAAKCLMCLSGVVKEVWLWCQESWRRRGFDVRRSEGGVDLMSGTLNEVWPQTFQCNFFYPIFYHPTHHAHTHTCLCKGLMDRLEEIKKPQQKLVQRDVIWHSAKLIKVQSGWQNKSIGYLFKERNYSLPYCTCPLVL